MQIIILWLLCIMLQKIQHVSGSGYMSEGKLQVLNEAESSDKFGKGLSISSDGSIMAIGVPNKANANVRGSVYVFRYDTSTNSWNKIDKLVPNDSDKNEFGYVVRVSSNGNIIVVGAPQIYPDVEKAGYVFKYKTSTDSWIQKDKLSGYAFSGASISSDGNIIAAMCGSIFYVFTKNNNNDKWSEVFKADATRPGANDCVVGTDIDISGDGNTIALGCSWDGTHSVIDSRVKNATGFLLPWESGAVYVYRYDSDTTSWNLQKQLVQNNGYVTREEAHRIKFGSSVSLSFDGNTLAVGVVQAQKHVENSVYIFKYLSSWQVNGILTKPLPGGYFLGRYNVRLTSDGNTLAATTTRAWAGVYKYDNNAWNLVGNLSFEKPFYHSDNIDISSDANIVAVSAYCDYNPNFQCDQNYRGAVNLFVAQADSAHNSGLYGINYGQDFYEPEDMTVNIITKELNAMRKEVNFNEYILMFVILMVVIIIFILLLLCVKSFNNQNGDNIYKQTKYDTEVSTI